MDASRAGFDLRVEDIESGRLNVRASMDPLSTIRGAYATLFRAERFEQLELAAADLLACSHDPGFREGDAQLIVWDAPGARCSGFCVPLYRGERVGPFRSWGMWVYP